MIGKAKSNLSLGNTIGYNLKQKSVLFYTNNLVGENIEDYRMQMEDLQKCYRGYGKQLLIHAVLSPATEDGKRLDESTWQKIADSYLQEMKLKEHYQSIGFIHRDKEHTHAHLVISKINMEDYKLFQDSFIGRKSQFIADRIAKEFGLVRAMEIKRENLKNLLAENENSKSKTANKSENIKSQKQPLPSIEKEEPPKGIRQQFNQTLKQINEQKFNTPEEYFSALEKNGFKVIRHFDDKQNLRGYSITKDGTMMSATAVSKEFSLSKLGLVNISYTATKEKSYANAPTIKEENTQKIIEPIFPIKKSTPVGVELLTDPRLKDSLYKFLKDYGIDKETIDKSELQFIKHKNYYYTALNNNSGGWAVMNPFTNNNIGAEDMTTIGHHKNATLVICEDVMSYLRQLQNCKQSRPTNYLVLNGIFDEVNLKEQLERLQPEQISYDKKEQRVAVFLQGFSQYLLSISEVQNASLIVSHLNKLAKNHSMLSHANAPSSTRYNMLANFIDILLSDEYQANTVSPLMDQKKKKKKRRRLSW